MNRCFLWSQNEQQSKRTTRNKSRRCWKYFFGVKCMYTHRVFNRVLVAWVPICVSLILAPARTVSKKKERKTERSVCSPHQRKQEQEPNNNNSKQENLFRTFPTNRAKAIRQESVESTQRALHSLKMRGSKMDTYTCTYTLMHPLSQLICVYPSISRSFSFPRSIHFLSFFSLHVHAHVQQIDMYMCIGAHTPLKPATFTTLLERTGEAFSWKYWICEPMCIYVCVCRFVCLRLCVHPQIQDLC